MTIAIITGSCGLVGSESVRYFARLGFTVVGIDNDMRRYFFGDEASTGWMKERLETELGDAYRHHACDIRDADAIDKLFAQYEGEIGLVIHTAAQPSHDWAAREVMTDFTVNANGTLNMLEATRKRAPEAVFIFTSTNKVYGDTPNFLPLIETETRWSVDPSHPYAARGIDEEMSIDRSKHSLFGASKVAADIMTQEYGRYFGMKTGVFRGGCLTGPSHSGAELHGFLSYLTKCVMTGKPYTIFGYKGKQVRDNIHSDDLAKAFHSFYETPRPGEVYNMGGGVASNCSVLEAFAIAEKVTGKKANFTLADENRIGDHIWYISDLGRFKSHYPEWDIRIGVEQIIEEIVAETERRLVAGEGA